jgi:membrane-associated phospholipid phosphatase
VKNDKGFYAALRYLAPVLLPLAAGLAAAAVWDLPVSRAMYSPGAPWAALIERYGEMPGLLLAVWAILLLNATLSGGKPRRVLLGLFNFIVCELLLEYALLVFACGTLGLRKPPEVAAFAAARGLLIRAIAASSTLAAMLLFRYILKNYAASGKVFARIAAAQFAVSQVLVQSFKSLWGRVRFRDLAPGFANFCPWYIPQGAAGNQSFPSGHTALAWMLLPAFLLCKKSRALRTTVLGLSIMWGITVGLGRITAGAHYASDVLFASLLTIIPFLLLLRREKELTRRRTPPERSAV